MARKVQREVWWLGGSNASARAGDASESAMA